MKKFHCKIEGISEYLMHRFAGGDDKVATKVGKKDYKAETETALYKLADTGEIYVPSSQIHGSLIDAGKQLRVVGKGKSTYSKLFGAFILIEPSCILITPQKYTIDERPVVIQKSRIIRYRPKWAAGWKLEFDVIIAEDDISPEVVKQAFDNAGRYVGIGDFRVNRGGSFGRYHVVKWEEIKG